MQQIVISKTAEDTERYGSAIGRLLKGGETIELASDLGGGKTTFVRGLAEGAGSADHVSSPTFTVSKFYQTPKLSIHHFDFYRLGEPGLVAHELSEVTDDPGAVTVVEWGQGVQHVLPTERLTITITRQADDSRRWQLDYPKALAYLLIDFPARGNT